MASQTKLYWLNDVWICCTRQIISGWGRSVKSGRAQYTVLKYPSEPVWTAKYLNIFGYFGMETKVGIWIFRIHSDCCRNCFSSFSLPSRPDRYRETERGTSNGRLTTCALMVFCVLLYLIVVWGEYLGPFWMYLRPRCYSVRMKEAISLYNRRKEKMKNLVKFIEFFLTRKLMITCDYVLWFGSLLLELDFFCSFSA